MDQKENETIPQDVKVSLVSSSRSVQCSGIGPQMALTLFCQYLIYNIL